jgi:hypothetical protein
MSEFDQTTRKDEKSSGLTGFFRNTLHTGLGVAENMHQSAMEVPLNLLKGVGVSEEQTTELKDKHRNLLRGMYGSIDSIASKFVDVGEEKATKLATEIRDRVDNNEVIEKDEPETEDESPETTS